MSGIRGFAFCNRPSLFDSFHEFQTLLSEVSSIWILPMSIIVMKLLNGDPKSNRVTTVFLLNDFLEIIPYLFCEFLFREI